MDRNRSRDKKRRARPPSLTSPFSVGYMDDKKGTGWYLDGDFHNGTLSSKNEELRKSIVMGLLLLGDCFCFSALLLINKYIFTYRNFHYPLFISAWNFAASLVCIVLKIIGSGIWRFGIDWLDSESGEARGDSESAANQDSTKHGKEDITVFVHNPGLLGRRADSISSELRSPRNLKRPCLSMWSHVRLWLFVRDMPTRADNQEPEVRTDISESHAERNVIVSRFETVFLLTFHVICNVVGTVCNNMALGLLPTLVFSVMTKVALIFDLLVLAIVGEVMVCLYGGGVIQSMQPFSKTKNRNSTTSYGTLSHSNVVGKDDDVSADISINNIRAEQEMDNTTSSDETGYFWHRFASSRTWYFLAVLLVGSVLSISLNCGTSDTGNASFNSLRRGLLCSMLYLFLRGVRDVLKTKLIRREEPQNGTTNATDTRFSPLRFVLYADPLNLLFSLSCAWYVEGLSDPWRRLQSDVFFSSKIPAPSKSAVVSNETSSSFLENGNGKSGFESYFTKVPILLLLVISSINCMLNSISIAFVFSRLGPVSTCIYTCLKTAPLIFYGHWVFGDSLPWYQLCGVVVVCIGVVGYAFEKHDAQRHVALKNTGSATNHSTGCGVGGDQSGDYADDDGTDDGQRRESGRSSRNCFILVTSIVSILVGVMSISLLYIQQDLHGGSRGIGMIPILPRAAKLSNDRITKPMSQETTDENAIGKHGNYDIKASNTEIAAHAGTSTEIAIDSGGELSEASYYPK